MTIATTVRINEKTRRSKNLKVLTGILNLVIQFFFTEANERIQDMEQLDLHMKTKKGIVTKRRKRENLEKMTKTVKNPRSEGEVVKTQRKKRKQGTVLKNMTPSPLLSILKSLSSDFNDDFEFYIFYV